jgi:hypothetical protein
MASTQPAASAGLPRRDPLEKAMRVARLVVVALTVVLVMVAVPANSKRQHTVTFTIRMLGAARNMGSRWEFDVGPGAVFSNLDEGKKALYFNESGTGEMGNLRGNSRLFLPAQATQPKYDDSRKMVTYVMPKPSSGGAKTAFRIPAVVLLVLGLGAFGASFVAGKKPRHMPPA